MKKLRPLARNTSVSRLNCQPLHASSHIPYDLTGVRSMADRNFLNLSSFLFGYLDLRARNCVLPEGNLKEGKVSI
jgi:hypothetical protein